MASKVVPTTILSYLWVYHNIPSPYQSVQFKHIVTINPHIKIYNTTTQVPTSIEQWFEPVPVRIASTASTRCLRSQMKRMKSVGSQPSTAWRDIAKVLAENFVSYMI